MNAQVQGDNALLKRLEATKMPRLWRFGFAAAPDLNVALRALVSARVSGMPHKPPSLILNVKEHNWVFNALNYISEFPRWEAAASTLSNKNHIYVERGMARR